MVDLLLWLFAFVALTLGLLILAGVWMAHCVTMFLDQA